ncbi:MAG: hypothetical protein IJB79_03935 [Candidatus Gastranaerophilales bacterium]|nr:hypothetical protein [Candidatus Gastranaerophilales bacterium]
MVNKRKKKAMALVLIVMVITTLSFVMMASVQVLTKSHTKYTTGMSKDGKINANQSKGRFLCYIDPNGVLKQVTVKYKTNGDIDENPALNQTKDGSCVFTIPKQANSFKITLIGGGGGGSLPKAELNFNAPVEENGEDSIVVGENLTNFTELFAMQNKYIDQATVEKDIYNDFFAKLAISIKASSPAGGSSGAMRKFDLIGSSDAYFKNFKQLLGKSIEYREIAENRYDNLFQTPDRVRDIHVKIRNALRQVTSSTYENYIGNTSGDTYTDINITCYGGLPRYFKDGSLVRNCPYYNYFCASIKNSMRDSRNQNRYQANMDGRCSFYAPRPYSAVGYYTMINSGYDSFYTNIDEGVSFAVNYNGQEHVVRANQGFRFALTKNLANIYDGVAGQPGEVTVFESKFISKDKQNEIVIPKSALGLGGRGGSAGFFDGEDGGDTTLVVSTNVGDQTITAKGGKGGVNTQARVLENYIDIPSQQDLSKEQNFYGKNGLLPNVILNSDFKLHNLSPGISAPLGSAITPATTPGSSGASGAMVWNKAGTRLPLSYAKPQIKFISTNGNVVPLREVYLSNNAYDYAESHSMAGDGASGAIMIEW